MSSKKTKETKKATIYVAAVRSWSKSGISPTFYYGSFEVLGVYSKPEDALRTLSQNTEVVINEDRDTYGYVYEYRIGSRTPITRYKFVDGKLVKLKSAPKPCVRVP